MSEPAEGPPDDIAMNILMLAPEPFFEPRGTPISIYFRIHALGELGHRSPSSPTPSERMSPASTALRIVRSPNLLGIRRVKIGPSLAKIPLDFLLSAARRPRADQAPL